MKSNISRKLTKKIKVLPQREHVVRMELNPVTDFADNNRQKISLGMFILAHKGMVSFPKAGTAIARLIGSAVQQLAKRPEVKRVNTHHGYVS